MREPPREAALAFLLSEHLLSPKEAKAALVLADTVLMDGLARLETAAAAGDARGCLEAAHALKGSLLNLGLSDLAAAAQAVTDAGRRGDVEACRRLAGALAQALIPFWR